nr:hypothetical protein [Cystobacter sp.]
MKHSWLRGAPFLLLGLTDMALSGYLLWAGSRAVLRAEGPAEVSLGGLVFLLALGIGMVGLLMFWVSWRAGWSAGRPLSRPLLAFLFLVGALPWVGVAAERYWPNERTAPERVRIVCIVPEATSPTLEVGKVVSGAGERFSGELFFDSLFEPRFRPGPHFIYVIDPARGVEREFSMACPPSGSRCAPLETSEADLRQALGLLPRCES